MSHRLMTCEEWSTFWSVLEKTRDDLQCRACRACRRMFDCGSCINCLDKPKDFKASIAQTKMPRAGMRSSSRFVVRMALRCLKPCKMLRYEQSIMYRTEAYVPLHVEGDPHPHPSKVCEPRNLHRLCPLHTTTELCADLSEVSTLQRDTVRMIKAAFERGENFLLGDATGLGKGRTIAALIHEWRAIHPGVRCLWISASARLASTSKEELCRECEF